MNQRILILAGLFFLMILGSCDFRYPAADPETFKGTPAYELVKALDNEKWASADEILKRDPSLARYYEPQNDISVLHWAVSNENEGAVKLLLAYNADVNKATKFNLHPLTAYTINYNAKNDSILLLLLRHQPINDSLTERNRNEALILASSRSLEQVKLLLRFGADPSYREEQDDYRQTALATAIIQAKFDVIYYLLFTYKMNPYYGYFVNINNDTIHTMQLLNEQYSDALKKSNTNYSKEYLKIICALEEEGYKDK